LIDSDGVFIRRNDTIDTKSPIDVLKWNCLTINQKGKESSRERSRERVQEREREFKREREREREREIKEGVDDSARESFIHSFIPFLFFCQTIRSKPSS